MTDLVCLPFESREVRIVMQDGEPWFVLSDVAKSVGLNNSRQVASRLDEDEKADVTLSDIRSGQRRKMTIISEPALMLVVMRSDSAMKKGTIAYRFRRWVTHEVLPSIRKFGMYPPPSETALLPSEEENPWSGRDKSLAERFKEERLRWEAATGYKLAGTVPHISKNVVSSIENELGGIRKGRRIEFLLYAKFDILYVMTGERTMTTSELALRDAYRNGDPIQRFRLLASAEA